MRLIDGKKYYTIGEVGKLIQRSPQTIKNWLEWYIEQPKDIQQESPLPIFRQDIGFRKTRFIDEQGIELLKSFKGDISYGKLAENSRKKWGKLNLKVT